jgi:hypothetical protein
MVEQYQALRTLLVSTHELITKSGATEVDPVIYEMLAVPLCRLAKIIIPDINQKVDEIVYAADHNLQVNRAAHGADLHDADGNHYELKVSVCKQPLKRCNFNWPVPKGGNEADRRARLLASVREKVKGGYARFIVRNGVGADLFTYTLSEEFLVGYFSRIRLGKGGNHNMGGEYCTRCECFHRLIRYHMASMHLAKGKSLEWTDLVTPIRCPFSYYSTRPKK